MNTLFEVFYQTVFAFITILVLTRLLGKQQLSEMTYFEYINGITFGSIAANMATDLEPNQTWPHLFGLILFGLLTLGMSYITLNSRRAQRWLEGDPVLVISNGKILENNLRKSRYTVGEVLNMLRTKNVFDVSKVQYAVLENDGAISVMLKPEHEPLTAQNFLNTSQSTPKLPMELVVEGQIIYDNLRKTGKTGKWLLQELRKKASVGSVNQVFYAALESDGTLYVDKYQD